jgi:GMP synthase (glutamine-hydrolysing)
MKTAVAIRHVRFEDLGSFEPVLEQAGYRIFFLEAGLHDLKALDPAAADVLFVLGAPVGVHNNATYPFLDDEIALLKSRLVRNKPVFGICLGAQLIATALGAKVYPSGGKEIGFAPVALTGAGLQSPLSHLAGVPVLHWHGDTFDLPDGAAHLAATGLCPNQAFAVGRNVMAVQFHPEADCRKIERWLIGHACELAGAGIDPRTIREDAQKYGPVLQGAAEKLMTDWLEGLGE